MAFNLTNYGHLKYKNKIYQYKIYHRVDHCLKLRYWAAQWMKASDVFVLFVDKKTSDLVVYDTWNIRISWVR